VRKTLQIKKNRWHFFFYELCRESLRLSVPDRSNRCSYIKHIPAGIIIFLFIMTFVLGFAAILYTLLTAFVFIVLLFGGRPTKETWNLDTFFEPYSFAASFERCPLPRVGKVRILPSYLILLGLGAWWFTTGSYAPGSYAPGIHLAVLIGALAIASVILLVRHLMNRAETRQRARIETKRAALTDGKPSPETGLVVKMVEHQPNPIAVVIRAKYQTFVERTCPEYEFVKTPKSNNADAEPIGIA
jgi:hypothetical protein